MIRAPINPRTAPDVNGNGHHLDVEAADVHREPDLSEWKPEEAAAPHDDTPAAEEATPVAPRAVERNVDSAAEIHERKDRTETARRWLAARHHHKDGTTLVRSQQTDYEWTGAAYEEREPEMVRSDIRLHLDRQFVRVGSGENETTERYKPNRNDVQEVQTAAQDLVITSATPPAWLDGRGRPSPREVLPCQNCILDLSVSPPAELPLTPLLFTTSAVPFAYDPTAPAPDAWLTFLDCIFHGDTESIAALQQWFGYCLTADTSQQKILLLVGPPRSGKGTIARVLASLIGIKNCCAPTLASLGTPFGLSPLLNKRLAVIGDARLSGKTDQAMVVERLLNLSGEDTITIDRKYLPPVTTSGRQMGLRLVVMTNELPRLNDPSGAVASRFVVLMLRDSYLGREDVGLTERLLVELPGVLLWAIKGWNALRLKGRFVQPSAANEAIDELAAAVSPIRAFLAEWCNAGPEQSIECGELFSAWCAWCESQSRKPGSVQSFGVDLRAAFPALAIRQPRVGGTRLRHYVGIGLQLFASESAAAWRAKREKGNTT